MSARVVYSIGLSLHYSTSELVEPEVVATSPNRIKSPVPVYCGFSSENGGRERTCTSKARRLSICGVCYSRLTTRPKNTNWSLPPVLPRHDFFTKEIYRLLQGGVNGRSPQCCPGHSGRMKPA